MKLLAEKIPFVKPRFFERPWASLEEFCDWWAREGNSIMQSPPDGITFVGNGPALVVYRKAPFQVQLFIGVPNSNIPRHAHPNVESYEIHVSGDVTFKVGNEPAFPFYAHKKRKDDSHVQRLFGYRTYIAAGQVHEAAIGPRGGAFLSIQKWAENMPPTSVDEDWEGNAMTAAHMQLLSHQLHAKLPEDQKDKHTPYIAGSLVD